MPPAPRQRVSRLAPLHEIHACIDAIARPVASRQVPVGQAIGCVLGADVAVAAPMPPRPLALRDGWAVASDRVMDAGPYAATPLDPAPLWVECGDLLPGGTDAVLAPDAVTWANGSAEALAAATPGDDILPAGADADPRAPLRKAGARMRAVDLAVLQTAGIDRVWTRLPRIRIIWTSPPVGESSDFVGLLIAGAMQREGGRVGWGPAGSELERLLAHEECDAVVTIGGTGMGERDATVATLARLGHVELHGMGIHPGDTAALGTIESRPVLLLPGRLDAALSAWLVVGRRLLARLTGLVSDDPPVRVPLVRKIVSTIGLAEVVPVGYCEGGVEPLASGYFPLRALTRAAGWILVPPESEGFPPGATVELRPFP